MKQKIITYFLLTVFLFSTIGITISLHYCEMTDSVSLQSCGMCDTKATSCCDEDSFTLNVKSANDVSCCSNKIIAASSDEKYLSVFYDFQKTDTKSFVFIIPVKLYFTEDLLNTFFVSDLSPPLNASNSLYLNNSTLLI